MKRKPTLIILSLVAAFSLLAVTAFASAPDYAGYEAFKTLASEQEDKDNFDSENATLEGSITIKDNGVTLLDLEANIKADGPKESLSGTFSIDAKGQVKDVELFVEDETLYIFDSENEEYYQVNHNPENEDMYEQDFNHGSRADDEMSSAEEELLDFVMGELKDDFELVNNSDGTETIKFELTKEEMPMLLNLLFSAMDHEKSDYRGDDEELDPAVLAKYPLLSDLKDIKVDMPEITENMELDYVKFAITTDENNEFVAVEFKFILTGDDEQGLSHTQEIEGKFAATEVGTTLVDQVDLEGKEVIVVDEEDFEATGIKVNNRAKGRR